MSKSRIIGLCLLMLSCCLAIQAQRVIIFHDGYIPSLKRTEVTGHVQMKENETQRIAPLQNAGVRVFCLTDSTYHQSRVTDKDGNFTLMAFLERDKDYEIQVSYLGTDTSIHTRFPTPISSSWTPSPSTRNPSRWKKPSSWPN